MTTQSNAPQPLTHKEACQSPCESCATAPCCRLLNLFKFRTNTLRDIDHAFFVLNFDNIELGLSRDGEWTVYLARPCSFLGDNNKCGIYNSPERPHICEIFNPVGCWYRRVYSSNTPDTDGFLRIDRQRMMFLAEHLLYDEHRTIVERPKWGMLVESFKTMPIASWNAQVPASVSVPTTEAQANFSKSNTPCMTCASYCCKKLVFRQDKPTSHSNLDFFRYALGFPGVTLGVSDDTWQLIVKTTCRHLEGNICGVFGRPERPNWCTFYDAWKCTFKKRFATTEHPENSSFAEVALENFPVLLKALRLSDEGRIVHLPTTESLSKLLSLTA